ncbi:MAG: hypothetical protein M1833_001055 [Piccolia ochrophora]|nr:MAG: hypothetical protein M1833_001055 [Piccolia ochrophora]
MDLTGRRVPQDVEQPATGCPERPSTPDQHRALKRGKELDATPDVQSSKRSRIRTFSGNRPSNEFSNTQDKVYEEPKSPEDSSTETGPLDGVSVKTADVKAPIPGKSGPVTPTPLAKRLLSQASLERGFDEIIYEAGQSSPSDILSSTPSHPSGVRKRKCSSPVSLRDRKRQSTESELLGTQSTRAAVSPLGSIASPLKSHGCGSSRQPTVGSQRPHGNRDQGQSSSTLITSNFTEHFDRSMKDDDNNSGSDSDKKRQNRFTRKPTSRSRGRTRSSDSSDEEKTEEKDEKDTIHGNVSPDLGLDGISDNEAAFATPLSKTPSRRSQGTPETASLLGQAESQGYMVEPGSYRAIDRSRLSIEGRAPMDTLPDLPHDEATLYPFEALNWSRYPQGPLPPTRAGPWGPLPVVRERRLTEESTTKSTFPGPTRRETRASAAARRERSANASPAIEPTVPEITEPKEVAEEEKKVSEAQKSDNEKNPEDEDTKTGGHGHRSNDTPFEGDSSDDTETLGARYRRLKQNAGSKLKGNPVNFRNLPDLERQEPVIPETSLRNSAEHSKTYDQGRKKLAIKDKLEDLRASASPSNLAGGVKKTAEKIMESASRITFRSSDHGVQEDLNGNVTEPASTSTHPHLPSGFLESDSASPAGIETPAEFHDEVSRMNRQNHALRVSDALEQGGVEGDAEEDDLEITAMYSSGESAEITTAYEVIQGRAGQGSENPRIVEARATTWTQDNEGQSTLGASSVASVTEATAAREEQEASEVVTSEPVVNSEQAGTSESVVQSEPVNKTESTNSTVWLHGMPTWRGVYNPAHGESDYEANSSIQSTPEEMYGRESSNSEVSDALLEPVPSLSDFQAPTPPNNSLASSFQQPLHRAISDPVVRSDPGRIGQVPPRSVDRRARPRSKTVAHHRDDDLQR